MGKPNDYQIALEVWQGKWGSAPERYELLKEAGYDPERIQDLVETFSPEDLALLAKGFTNSDEPTETLEVKVNLKKVKQVVLIFEE